MSVERTTDELLIAERAGKLLEMVEKRTPLTKILVETFKKHTNPATWFLAVDGLWRIVGKTKIEEPQAQIALGWDDPSVGKIHLGVFDTYEYPDKLRPDISFEALAFPGSPFEPKWIFLQVPKDRLTLYAGPENPGFGYDNLLLKMINEVAKKASRVKATRK